MNTAGLVICLGIGMFLLWGGGHTFFPTHIAWVMAGFDTPQHYIGWEFFRKTPLLQWPIGSNSSYGSDAASTIVLADSIPLAAIAFKLLDQVLPADFQYFGIWILCCFELQAWFAYKLMGRLTADPLLRLLGSAMFLTASIFLVRIYLHPALAAQWILLAAMYLCLDNRLRSVAWGALLITAALVDAYLLVMAGALWLSSLTGRAFYRSERISVICRDACTTLLLVVLAMWGAGYFVASAVVPAPYTSHSNLLTFMLTGTCGWSEWSRYLPCLTLSADAAEKTTDGFGYFGLGILLLVIAALMLRFRPADFTRPSLPTPLLRPLWIACFLLLFFAVGTRAYIGNYVLFSFTPPTFLSRLWSTFRGAARMEWPMWYLVLTGSLSVVISRLPRKIALVFLVIALAVQALDLSGAAANMRQSISRSPRFENELTSPTWVNIAGQYRNLAYIPAPSVQPSELTGIPAYRQLAHYAALHGMSINIAYLARIDRKKLAAAGAKRESMIRQGLSESETFYVVEDANLWSRVVCAPDHGQWHGQIQNMRVLIPFPEKISGLPKTDSCVATRG